MALAQDTDIMLLDEPTTFLDLAHQVEVLDLLVDLNQPEERTIVLVLHDLNQACRYADHLIAMKDGAIVAEGNPREVITEELVDDVFGLAVRSSPTRSPVRRWSSRSAATSLAPTPSTMRSRRPRQHLPLRPPWPPPPPPTASAAPSTAEPHTPIRTPGPRVVDRGSVPRAVRPPEFTTRCPRGGRGPTGGGGGPAPLSNHPRVTPPTLGNSRRPVISGGLESGSSPPK